MSQAIRRIALAAFALEAVRQGNRACGRSSWRISKPSFASWKAAPGMTAQARARELRREIRKLEDRGRCVAGRSEAQHVRDPSRRNRSRARQERSGGSQPPPGGFGRQEVRQPRSAPAGSDPGRQHRPDARRRQVRIPARLQVFDLRHLVDSPGHHARHRRPVAHHSHSGAHEREHEQVPARHARARKGTGPRADQRRNQPPHGYSGGEGPEAEDHLARSGVARNAGGPRRRIRAGRS